MTTPELLVRCDALKQQFDRYRPLAPQTAQSLRDYFKVGLTYTSNALEGNTLTETETKIIIEDGLTIGGHPLREIYEATGHAKAYDEIYELTDRNAPLTEADVLRLHALFYGQIDEDNAGKYRRVQVFISASNFPLPPPQEVPQLMSEFVQWYNRAEHTTMHPVLLAATAHLKFVFIHPFIDGNGRLARLLVNLALLRAGYQICIIPPILRNDYMRHIETAHTDPDPFFGFIAERVIETQREILRLFNDGE